MQMTETQLVHLLKQLVAVPSVNPGFATPEDDPSFFGEKRYAHYLADQLRQIGFQVWLDEVLPERYNVMARLPGTQGKHSIALQSHLDTVQISNITVPPWGQLEGNRLYGRGSSDPKASTAAQLAALGALAKKRRMASDLYFIGTIDEEISAKGSLYVKDNYRFDACIVGEPTELAPIVAHKGSVRFELIAEGVSCHSSNPELGRNAIWEMMSLLSALREPFTAYTKNNTHPLTGPATWTPTLIRGGEGLNTVPGTCRVAIERRLVPGETPEQVLDFIDEFLAQQNHLGNRWLRGEVFVLSPPLECDLSSPLVPALQQALTSYGLDPKPRGVAYGTDASKIAQSGTPCVVFGPGSIDQAHGANEWVDVTTIATAAKVLIATVEILDKRLSQGSQLPGD